MYIKEIRNSVFQLIDEQEIESHELTQIISEGFTKVVDDGLPSSYDSSIMECHSYYEKLNDGTYVAKYTIRIAPRKIQEKIQALKDVLSASDYKIIKSIEYNITSNDDVIGNHPTIDYDLKALHAERQAIRDEINHLETLLAKSCS